MCPPPARPSRLAPPERWPKRRAAEVPIASPAPRRRDPSFVKGLLGGLHFRDPILQCLDAMLVAGMVREELWGASPTGHLLGHPLPEADRFIRVIARERHQEQTDVVRLRLLLAVVGLAPDSSPRGQHAHERASPLSAHAGHGASNNLDGPVVFLFAGQALAGVMG